MDVGKLFPKAQEPKHIGPISKQKKPAISAEEEAFEDEGGWVAPEEDVTEVLKQPIHAWVSATGPLSIHPLYQTYNDLVREVVNLRDKKGKDYGTTEDPFANVRGAQEFGVKPWIGAANSANEALTRIKQYAKTGTLENDSIRDSMLDLANYALITLTLWEEENES
jgi:hypothetical protein